MKFDLTTRTLTLEAKDCTTCAYGAGGRGEYTGSKTCERCGGTGNGPRGGKGTCRGCYHGTVPDFDNPIPCPSCTGLWENYAVENFCDNAPAEAVQAMVETLTLVRRDRAMSQGETLLGLPQGLWSCIDYGRSWDKDDAVVLDEVREKIKTERVQATKIVRPYERGDETATLRDHLVVLLTRDGYHVLAFDA